MKPACARPCSLTASYIATTADLPFTSVSSVEMVLNGILVALPHGVAASPAHHVNSVVGGMRVTFTVPVQYGAMVLIKGETVLG
jgi:hypothetical protein